MKAEAFHKAAMAKPGDQLRKYVERSNALIALNLSWKARAELAIA